MARVRAAETLTLTGENEGEGEGLLIYDVSLDHRRYLAVYIFVSDQLVRAKYILQEEYANEMSFLVAVDSLKETVTKKYGAPESDNEFWTGDLYREDPMDRGNAVKFEELSMYTSWNAPGMKIILAALGEEYEIKVSVEYISTAHESMEAAFRETDLLENF
jgi:hypothetical protein